MFKLLNIFFYKVLGFNLLYGSLLIFLTGEFVVVFCIFYFSKLKNLSVPRIVALGEKNLTVFYPALRLISLEQLIASSEKLFLDESSSYDSISISLGYCKVIIYFLRFKDSTAVLMRLLFEACLFYFGLCYSNITVLYFLNTSDYYVDYLGTGDFLTRLVLLLKFIFDLSIFWI